jgi:hypothetical protein
MRPRDVIVWSCTSSFSYAFMALCLIKHRDSFTFYFIINSYVCVWPSLFMFRLLIMFVVRVMNLAFHINLLYLRVQIEQSLPLFFSATIIYIQGNQNTGSVLSTFDCFST